MYKQQNVNKQIGIRKYKAVKKSLGIAFFRKLLCNKNVVVGSLCVFAIFQGTVSVVLELTAYY